MSEKLAGLDDSKGKQRKLYREIYEQAYKIENAPCKRVDKLSNDVAINKGMRQEKIDSEKQKAINKLRDKSELSNIGYLLKHYRSVYDTYFIGVPTVIGSNGVEKILEFPLTDNEKSELNKTLKAVKNTVKETGL